MVLGRGRKDRYGNLLQMQGRVGAKRCCFQDVCRISHQKAEAPLSFAPRSPVVSLIIHARTHAHTHTHTHTHKHTRVYLHVHMYISEEKEENREKEEKRENLHVHMYISEQNERKRESARAVLTIQLLPPLPRAAQLRMKREGERERARERALSRTFLNGGGLGRRTRTDSASPYLRDCLTVQHPYSKGFPRTLVKGSQDGTVGPDRHRQETLDLAA